MCGVRSYPTVFYRKPRRATQQYARVHGFSIVKTYAEYGKSGVVAQHRACLLKAVVSSEVNYKGVLVYDVSRGGVFQTATEPFTMNI
jgi:hypothetical protein